jgi:xylulokinase
VLQSVAGAADRIAAVAVCGQMHGTVLIDAGGEPVLDAVPLWNDKRTRALVERVQRDYEVKEFLKITANPPEVAWQAFKLAWINSYEQIVQLAKSAPAGSDPITLLALPQ